MLATIRENKPYFTIANFLLFQVGWLVCIIAAANNYAAVSVLSCVTIIGLHLSMLNDIKSEVKLILISAFIGFIVDSLNIAFTIFQPVQAQTLPLAPLWLVSLWMLFAICLRHSLSWLGKKPWLSAFFGAVCAPLAYYAGAELGAIAFPRDNLWLALSAIALEWVLITPWLIAMAKRSENLGQST